MAVQTILKMGNPKLYEPAEVVSHFDSNELYRTIRDMYDTMSAYEGAGLAAPQIGVPKQIIIFGVPTPRYPNETDVPETVLINPEITVLTDAVEEYWEGCLSVPGFRGLVARPRHIGYRGYDPKGNLIEREAVGFHARVVQHEVDHVQGILFPTLVRNLAYFGYEEEIGFDQIVKRVVNES